MEFHNTGILGKKAPGVKEDKIDALIVLFVGYWILCNHYEESRF